MNTIQNFDEDVCIKAKCIYYTQIGGNPACFSIPEECDINKKAGFPKKITKEELEDTLY